MFGRLREDINSVFRRDPAARNAFEVLTNYPGLHALLAHRINHRLWNSGLKWPARTGSSVARWLTGIEIHPGARIGRGFFIDHGMGVVIGETAVIGDNVTLYQGVTLGGTSWKQGKRHPTLGDNVVVGAGAKLLGPFTVGTDAKVGSNAVVTRQVPEGATVVGIPGRVIVRKQAEEGGSRSSMAEKIGFDAYGLSEEMPDPIARSIRSILDHMQVVDERVESMGRALKQLDAGCDTDRLPPVPTEDFESVEDNADESPNT